MHTVQFRTKRGDGKSPEVKNFQNRGTLIISNFEDWRGMKELTPRMFIVKPILNLNSNNHDAPVYLKNSMIKEFERTDLFSVDNVAVYNKNQY